MYKYWLRHLMAAIIVADEVKVPNIRGADAYLSQDRLRKQFGAIIENTYNVVDLMLDIGDQNLQETE